MILRKETKESTSRAIKVYFYSFHFASHTAKNIWRYYITNCLHLTKKYVLIYFKFLIKIKYHQFSNNEVTTRYPLATLPQPHVFLLASAFILREIHPLVLLFVHSATSDKSMYKQNTLEVLTKLNPIVLLHTWHSPTHPCPSKHRTHHSETPWHETRPQTPEQRPWEPDSKMNLN